MRPIEILICDDHEIFRKGIHNVMQGADDIRIVGEAENGQACLEKIRELEPDLVLLDIRMPKMNGIECLRAIREQQLPVKVVAMTQFDEKRLIRQMMRLSVDGYVLKHTNFRELQRCFRTVVGGRSYFSDEVTEALQSSSSQLADPLFPNLGEKEKEVLWRICNEQSSKQIAMEMDISIRTVENHRTSLLRKTGAANLAGLVKWAVLNQLDLPFKHSDHDTEEMGGE